MPTNKFTRLTVLKARKKIIKPIKTFSYYAENKFICYAACKLPGETIRYYKSIVESID